MINLKKHIQVFLLICANLFLLFLIFIEIFSTWSGTIRIFWHNYEKQFIYSILFILFYIFLSFLILKKICFTIQSKPIKIILYFINYFVYFLGFIFILSLF